MFVVFHDTYMQNFYCVSIAKIVVCCLLTPHEKRSKIGVSNEIYTQFSRERLKTLLKIAIEKADFY